MSIIAMKKELNLTYYAKIVPEDAGYIVTLRDLPNVFSEGNSIDEALSNITEALNGVLSAMNLIEQEITLPSEAKAGEYPISVSPEVAAPILLYLLRKEKTQTIKSVADIMNIPYQQYQRLEHSCNMTLRSLKRAATAMGATVEIKIHF